MIRALIFDFDGTILDTEMPAFLGWQYTYRQFGHTIEQHEYAKVVGSDYSKFDPKKLLEQKVGRSLDWTVLEPERRKFYYEIIAKNEALPGVRTLICEAKARSLRCAVASSSPIEWVEKHLVRLELRNAFEFASCADGTHRTKPAPDVYLRALKLLGVSADETLAIEDSPHGMAAAMAAGIHCVGVPNAMTRALAFPDGAKLISTLEGMMIDDLLNGLRLA